MRQPIKFEFLVNPLDYVILTGTHRGLLRGAERIIQKVQERPDLPEGYRDMAIQEIKIGHVIVGPVGVVEESVEVKIPGITVEGTRCPRRRITYRRLTYPPTFLRDVASEMVASGELKSIIVEEIKSRLKEVYG